MNDFNFNPFEYHSNIVDDLVVASVSGLVIDLLIDTGRECFKI